MHWAQETFPVMLKQPHRRVGMVKKKTTRLGLDWSISPIDEGGGNRGTSIRELECLSDQLGTGRRAATDMTYGKNLVH